MPKEPEIRHCTPVDYPNFLTTYIPKVFYRDFYKRNFNYIKYFQWGICSEDIQCSERLPCKDFNATNDFYKIFGQKLTVQNNYFLEVTEIYQRVEIPV